MLVKVEADGSSVTMYWAGRPGVNAEGWTERVLSEHTSEYVSTASVAGMSVDAAYEWCTELLARIENVAGDTPALVIGGATQPAWVAAVRLAGDWEAARLAGH